MHAGGLALIAAVFLTLFLRLDDTRQPEPNQSGRDDPGELGRADIDPQIGSTTILEAATTGNGHASPPPLMRPDGPTIPEREPLAGLPEAVERFGDAFSIRHPSYLPADVAPFTVNWQPDAQPSRGQQGHGELYTWFYSAEHGAVLVLAQGPATGVWPLTAGDDRAGRVRLANGTEAVWVIGHPTSVTGGVSGGPVWEGTEITLGIPTTDGGGWYLRSPIVGLEELIRVANSLQPAPGRD
jgi:hypothetical protein